MSILLDAVTRAKQQEMGEQLDPVLTPRAQYRRQSSASSYLKPLAVLVAAVLAGGALAWGWHLLDTNKKPLAPETSSVGGKPRSSKPGNKMSLKDISNRLKPLRWLNKGQRKYVWPVRLPCLWPSRYLRLRLFNLGQSSRKIRGLKMLRLRIGRP